MFSSSSLCDDKDAMLRWISENVFKFFFMEWQGCNVKMNKWECFQVLLYAMMNKWGCFQVLLYAMQGCNVKMNKWGCFQVLLYAMTRMQC